MKWKLFPLLIILSNSYMFSVCAEPRPSTSQEKPAARQNINSVAAAADARVLGSVEVRPSYKSMLGEFHSEDSAVLGYQFTRDTSATYKQDFNTNVYDPHLIESQSGLNAYLVDGYFKEKITNLINIGSFSLGYEGRQYLPTWALRRQAGMLTAIRNYLKIKYQATSRLILTFEETPVVHLYDQPGSITRKGPLANPIFENRSSVGAEYAFSDRLKLILPVMLSDVRNREYDSAAVNNSKWSHKLWVNPELYYTVNPNVTVGMGYYSDNLLKNGDFAETALGEGLEQGTTQLIFSANL